MKKIIALVLMLSSGIVAAQQSINDFEYVIVPIKYDFLSQENMYRLNTITKFNLSKMGFKVFYSNEQLSKEQASDRCNKLYADVEKAKSLLTTKLIIVLKDCQNNIVYRSSEGKSKEKEYKTAYPEALENAFQSMNGIAYSYNGKNGNSETKSVVATEIPVKKTEMATPVSSAIDEASNYLFAQPIANGYQLVDKTPKIVLKIYKTSQPDYFTAQGDGINGALLKKNGEWILEYYKNDQPVSEKLLIKF